MQILTINYQNFEKPSRNPSNRTKVKIQGEKKNFNSSPKKFGSAYAQSLHKCSNIEILANIEEKEKKKFGNFPRAYQVLNQVEKKFKIISSLCTFKYCNNLF